VTVPGKTILPLTRAQQEIWLAHMLAPSSQQFNLAQYIEIAGRVDTDMFILTIERLVAEMEPLRTRFDARDTEVETFGDGPANSSFRTDSSKLTMPDSRPVSRMCGDPMWSVSS